MNRLFPLSGFLFIYSLMSGLPAIAENAFPPAYLPGLIQGDSRSRGCVDCHVLSSDGKDRRLNKSVALIPKHPDLTKAFKDTAIPETCFLCHKKGSRLGSLGANLHKAHYANTAASEFVKNYAGSCLNCHSLDVATGDMGFKSGSANW